MQVEDATVQLPNLIADLHWSHQHALLTTPNNRGAVMQNNANKNR
jgi:hypothetical protein